MPKVKENSWTQNQEKQQDPEQEGYVETETLGINTENRYLEWK